MALLHSYAHPEHERLLGALLAERLAAGAHVSLSSELVGTFREYERTATTVLDAALSPLVGSYLRRLAARRRARGLPEPEIMQSSGGLASIDRAAAHAALTVLSGPGGRRRRGAAAGGAGGRGERAVLRHGRHLVRRLPDRPRGRSPRRPSARSRAARSRCRRSTSTRSARAAARSPGATRGGALRVGPESAGALPGPACYGRGGELPTVTDANLLLGRLREDSAAGGRICGSIAPPPSARYRGLARELGIDAGECAAGIVRVAEAEMLRRRCA